MKKYNMILLAILSLTAIHTTESAFAFDITQDHSGVYTFPEMIITAEGEGDILEFDTTIGSSLTPLSGSNSYTYPKQSLESTVDAMKFGGEWDRIQIKDEHDRCDEHKKNCKNIREVLAYLSDRMCYTGSTGGGKVTSEGFGGDLRKKTVQTHCQITLSDGTIPAHILASDEAKQGEMFKFISGLSDRINAYKNSLDAIDPNYSYTYDSINNRFVKGQLLFNGPGGVLELVDRTPWWKLTLQMSSTNDAVIQSTDAIQTEIDDVIIVRNALDEMLNEGIVFELDYRLDSKDRKNAEHFVRSVDGIFERDRDEIENNNLEIIEIIEQKNIGKNLFQINLELEAEQKQERILDSQEREEDFEQQLFDNEFLMDEFDTSAEEHLFLIEENLRLANDIKRMQDEQSALMDSIISLDNLADQDRDMLFSIPEHDSCILEYNQDNGTYNQLLSCGYVSGLTSWHARIYANDSSIQQASDIKFALPGDKAFIEGHIAFRDGNYAEARANFEDIINLNKEWITPEDETAITNQIGRTYLAEEMYEEAKLLFAFGNDHHSANGLAFSNLMLGNGQEAQKVWFTVITNDPENTDAHNGLALMYKSQEKLDLAEYHYQQSLGIQPNNPDTIKGVEIFCEETGRMCY